MKFLLLQTLRLASQATSLYTREAHYRPTVHLKGVTHYTLQGKACEKEYEQMPVLLLFFRQVKPALWKAPLTTCFFIVTGIRSTEYGDIKIRTNKKQEAKIPLLKVLESLEIGLQAIRFSLHFKKFSSRVLDRVPRSYRPTIILTTRTIRPSRTQQSAKQMQRPNRAETRTLKSAKAFRTAERALGIR